MNILNICTSFPPALQYGGPPLAAHAVARELIRLGHRVFTVTCDLHPDEPGLASQGRTASCQGVPVRYCRSFRKKPFFSYELFRELKRRVADTHVCLVRGNWNFVNFMANTTCTWARVPYVVYPEGIFDPWALNHHGWRKRLWWKLVEQTNYRNAAAIIALTQEEAQQVRQMGLQGRIEVIPNGVDPGEFADALDRQALEKKFPQLKPGPFILFLGRLHQKKGLSFTLQALARLPQRHREVQLVVAGPDEGGHQQHLEKLAQELGLGDRVVFLGPVTGRVKAGLLTTAELFVLNSLSEGLPLTVLEAMACGTPVVISPFCHLPEVEGAGAGLIPALDPQAIARGLEELLADSNFRRQMADQARKLVREKFSWHHIGKLTEGLLIQLNLKNK